MPEERIRVIAYSGYRGEVTSKTFFLHGKQIEVVEILSRWIEEGSINRHYLESVYKLTLFVIPAPYQVRGKLQRVSRTHGKGWIPVFTGMTKRNDYNIYGQTL